MPHDIATPATGDIIAVSHLNQYKDPVQELENGAALYRADTGTSANQYVVSFSSGNKISALQDGQMVNFKVRSGGANTGAATLQVVGPSGALSAMPLVKQGGVALAPGDLQANQMLAAIYNSQSGGRFELLGTISPFLARAKLTTSSATTLGGGYTAIAWSAASESGGTFWSSGSNSIVTIPSGLDGTYQVSAQIDFTSISATTGFVLRLTVNNTQKVIHRITVPATALNTTLSISALLQLASGDAVRFEVARSSGTDMNVGDTFLQLTRLGS